MLSFCPSGIPRSSRQITEPDLGSDPGNPEQARQAVPGRIIETNIAFLIVGKQLECGFKTVISDPVGTEPEAEVYRLAVIRELMRDPAFGLKQITDIPMKAIRLSNATQVRTMLYVTHHADNALPTVIFTQPLEERNTLPDIPDLSDLRLHSSFLSPGLKPDLTGMDFPKPTPEAGKAEAVAVEPPYDLQRFCYYTFSHCRTYILEDRARRSFSSQSGICFVPGDVIVVYPTAFGGGEEVIPYKKNEAKREETLQILENGIKSYLKARPIDFGKIEFLSGVREHLLRLSDELMDSAEAADAHFKQELEQLNTFWKNEIAQKDRDLEAVNAQLQRQKEYAARLENEKSLLREEITAEREKLLEEIDARKAAIEFLRRRCDQPKDYDGIAEWVEAHFSQRLYLHPKAISRMLTRSNQCADVALVCDALDYLATDYWQQRYDRLPKDIALTRCAEKYGRPFEVKPTGQATIDFTPGDYKIRYFKNPQGKEIDSDLDYHLRVGNDSENLLRVYFLHDDARRIIVIGSLPDHLRAVKI